MSYCSVALFLMLLSIFVCGTVLAAVDGGMMCLSWSLVFWCGILVVVVIFVGLSILYFA